MLDLVNNTKTKICRRKALRLLSGILEFYKLGDRQVSLVVVGDAKMKSINKKHRGIDKTTDVLTFPLQVDMGAEPLATSTWGEIFINISEAKRVDKYYDIFGAKKSYSYIFYFLFTHGLLHLVGYDDKAEKDRIAMVELGKKFMDKYYK